jgi:hypothetical protein
LRMDADYLRLMAVGYLLTIVIETPILIVGLSRRHTVDHRLFAGIWLTACTYPVVWLVLPFLFPGPDDRGLYLLTAETFAPAAECLLFWLAFGKTEPRSRRATVQDMTAIVIANLLSFGLGELLSRTVGWEWLDGV